MRLIDAHKLEEGFKRIYNCEPANCQSLDWGTIKNTIRDQPEVDQVKHAHWIKSNYDNADGTIYKCSNCNTELFTAWNYCPNCGAKMDGGVVYD